MNLLTRYNLWKISRRARPDAAFVSRLASRFTCLPAGTAPHRVANFALRFSASVTALVLSLGLGTSAYAYTSDDVLPDSPLYPLRQTVESLEETVSVTPAAKQAVQEKQLQRRVKEIVVMRSRALPVKPAQAVKIRKELERLETGTEKEGAKEAAALVGVLEQRQKTKDVAEKVRLDKESDERIVRIQRRVKKLRQESRESRKKIESDER